MKTRNLTLAGIFMALGLVMHFLIPPLLFGVKPDFLLSMIFISLIIADDFKEALIIGISGGVMSALTTNFPGGQIPNFIEKIIVALTIFYLIRLLGKDKLGRGKIIIIFALGTLLSGLLFLSLALSITGQLELFIPSLPVIGLAMVVNAIFGLLLTSAYEQIKKTQSR
ncbi:MAG: tryptophan transporter [Anaerococcus sp.]|nr:tryptophan transporter [Anaerococcus sp.]